MRLGGYFFRVTIKSIADIAQFKTALMQLIKEINSKDIDNTSSVNKFNKGYVVKLLSNLCCVGREV
jgi:hypothetical protein